MVRDDNFGDSIFEVNASSTVTLWPMYSGPYEGLLFYSTSNNAINKDQVLNSSSNGSLKGSVYFPKSRFVLNSDSEIRASCGSWTANNFLFNSTATFEIEAGTASTCGFTIPFGNARNSALVK
jgi:hypothetical protein